MPVHLSIAGRSDTGRCRGHNEDALVIADVAGGHLLRGDTPRGRFDVGESGVLLAVSDGMGGENAGEVASALVVESLARAIMGSPAGAPVDVLKGAVQEANGEVRQASHEAGHQGMGATLTALLVKTQGSATTAFIAEVGDSRAYLLRAGRLTLLTKDQSYTQLLLDAGTLDASEAAKSHLHNVILQAMGHAGHIDTALGRLELRSRDCLLLCSDGLTNAVTEDEIRQVVLSSSGLEDACTRLVDLANDRGGKDNVTVIAAGVGGEGLPGGTGDDVAETFQILETFEPKVPRGSSREAATGRDDSGRS